MTVTPAGTAGFSGAVGAAGTAGVSGAGGAGGALVSKAMGSAGRQQGFFHQT